ncbi:hypothetical protein GQ457_05G011570 [Hibiscus cannabinus]
MVRLETPSPGDRNPVHCRQVWDEMSGEEDLDRWLVSSDRYRVRDRRSDGMVLSRRWSSDGSVKLQCFGKWHSVGCVAFRWLQVRKRETRLGQECRKRREGRSKWRNKEAGQRNRDMVCVNWKGKCGRWMSIQETKWKARGKRTPGVSRKWCLESFCKFSDDRGRRRCMHTTAMEFFLLGTMITCTWSERRQTSCDKNRQWYWDMGQFATTLGPTMTARETFPDHNDSIQENGPPLGSACAWGQRWIRGECFRIQCSPSLISDNLGKGCRHARDVAHDLGLSTLLLKEQAEGRIVGVRASQRGPRVNHLLYADDCILFIKNSDREARRMQEVLRIYEKSSVQKVNVDKSAIYFSKGTSQASRNKIQDILHMREEKELGNYLGLPLVVGKNKTNSLGFLNTRVDKRVLGWTKNLLSFGGREILLKAVAQALPAYAMQVFLIPDCILEPLVSTMRKFWWSGKAKERGWAHVAWGKLCLPKKQGGMRFRNMKNFNIALLGKQVWKLHTCRTSLCYKAKEALKEEFHWQVGIDSEIPIFQKPWGGDKRVELEGNYLDSPLNPVRCNEFMIAGKTMWNERIINQVTETVLHAVRECTRTQEIFALCGLDSKLPQGPFNSGFQWLEEVGQMLDGNQLQFLITLIWNIWNRRNRLIHQNQLLPAKLVVDYAQLLVGEIQGLDTTAPQPVSPNVVTPRWTKPEAGKIKINVDGAWSKERNIAAIGVVARDQHGMVIEAKAFSNGWQDWIVEGDAANIVTKLNSITLDRSVAASFLKEAHEALLTCPGSVVSYIPRDCNRVAHTLAQWQLNSNVQFTFNFITPNCIEDFVMDDAIYG